LPASARTKARTAERLTRDRRHAYGILSLVRCAGYGLGSNSMTGEQKSLLIYGALTFFFALFISGYLLD
jgi:hypothetical protein